MQKKSLILLLLVICSLPLFGDFQDGLDYYNTGLFAKADGWTNGEPFNCFWRAECVTFNGGIMTLRLDYEGGNPPYKSGEYRTNDFYSYGYFEVRMKPSAQEGTVSSFFTYTGPSDDNPWDEIDIEFLGKNTRVMQLNYFTNGVGNHETMVNLGFDAAEDFHTYGFEWRREYIKWYVDGKLVHTENGSRGPLPNTPGKIMMNHWPGIGVNDWLGPFNGQTPQYAYYDMVRYSSEGPGTVSIKGDVDGSKTVDIVDALKIAQYYVGHNPSDFNPEVADVNNDGSITIVDALRVAQFYVGLITTL